MHSGVISTQNCTKKTRFVLPSESHNNKYWVNIMHVLIVTCVDVYPVYQFICFNLNVI